MLSASYTKAFYEDHRDGTVHQFPFVPGHNPIQWKGLEMNRAGWKLLSPLAGTYFIVAGKI
jgi:hypothetical protein